jgi:hypothetical protein
VSQAITDRRAQSVTRGEHPLGVLLDQYGEGETDIPLADNDEPTIGMSCHRVPYLVHACQLALADRTSSRRAN